MTSVADQMPTAVTQGAKGEALVDAYAVYRLGTTGNASSAAQFTGDWQKLVGTVVTRVG